VANVLVIGLLVLLVPRVRSPAEVAASSEPPPPSVITSTVEQRRLVDEVVARGTIEASASTEVPPPAVDGAAVVTGRVPSVGSVIEEGGVVAEVSGRPLFVLAGPIPAYRDLTEGDAGADVRQLQEALERLGLLRRSPTGVFDDATSAAVRRLYTSAESTPMVEAAADGGEVVTLPAAELTYVHVLPATVHRAAPLGTELGDDDALLELAVGGLVVRAEVPDLDASGLEVGDEVVVTEERAGRTYQGTLAAIGEPEALPESGLLVRPVRVTLAEQPPIESAGVGVRLDVQVAATDGEALVVPSAAVSTDERGRATVLVRSADGRQVVPVTVSVSADGYLAVEADPSTDLAAGDEVVLGR
jgi:hypothetical protein